MTSAQVGQPDVAEEIGRRERKKRATRAQLEAAAVRLFMAHGYDAVTVADIARAADLDPTTYFRHFRSKEEVLFADSEEVLRRYRDAILSRPPEEPVLDAAVHGISALLQDLLDKDAEVVRARLVVADHPDVRAYVLGYEERIVRVLADVLASRMQVDRVRDPRPYLVASLLVAAARWLRAKSAQEGALPRSRDVVDHLRETVLHVAPLLR